MNKSNFTEKDFFPLESERLDEIQETFGEVADAIAKHYGDYTILSGMEDVKGNITDGYFIAGGRLIKFKESKYQPCIQIKKEITTVTTVEGACNVYEREWAETVATPKAGTEYYYLNRFDRVATIKEGEKNYETVEQWTGKYWIDGKKIYWKTLDFGKISSSKYLSNPIPGVAFVINAEGFGCDSNKVGIGYNFIKFQPRLENSYYPYYRAPYSSTTFAASFSFGATFRITNVSAEITYATNEGGRAHNYLTIYYTKTY